MPLRSERNQLYTIKAQRVTGAIIPALCTGSHQNSAVKRAWARVVLGWVTSWEVLVLHLFLRIFKCCFLFLLMGVKESEKVRENKYFRVNYMHFAAKEWKKSNVYTIKAQRVTGAIIPALMHRIPSELRS